MTKPFSVAWTVRCGELSKATRTQVLFDSSGRSALNIVVGVVLGIYRDRARAQYSVQGRTRWLLMPQWPAPGELREYCTPDPAPSKEVSFGYVDISAGEGAAGSSAGAREGF